jgi:hypothetical protein
MNRATTCLIAAAAALLVAVPVLVHGSHAGDGPRRSAGVSADGNRETHELEKVNGLKDINRDNEKLTEDEQKLIALEMQAVEAKGDKAPPLSTGQLRELAELRNRIGNRTSAATQSG